MRHEMAIVRHDGLPGANAGRTEDAKTVLTAPRPKPYSALSLDKIASRCNADPQRTSARQATKCRPPRGIRASWDVRRTLSRFWRASKLRRGAPAILERLKILKWTLLQPWRTPGAPGRTRLQFWNKNDSPRRSESVKTPASVVLRAFPGIVRSGVLADSRPPHSGPPDSRLPGILPGSCLPAAAPSSSCLPASRLA